jgi:aminomethyltransferase
MKKTVFYDAHLAMGGRMVPFAGYEMPIEFSGIKNEHLTVRHKVGVFDVSHMGEVWVSGPNAEKFTQYVTSNDVSKLIPGKVQYSCFPNGNGGIVDDLLVYKVEDDRFLLVINASNIEKDWNWLVKNKIEGVLLENDSDNTSQLAVQGPYAQKLLQKITDIDLSTIPYFNFKYGNIEDSADVLISNTGYTGSGGFELYFSNEIGLKILNAILEAGKEFDLVPAGLASRDTLRLESGFCLYGNDIDDNTSPLEAGLGWITKFTEGNDFIDRHFLEKQKEKGLERRLVGFELNERGIPRKDYPILNVVGESIGRVTSGTMSPLTSKAIGMGYVNLPFNEIGSEIYIGIRNKNISATVIKPPFFK